MVLLRSSYLALVLVLLGVTPATGSIIEGIEFTDLVSIDVPGGTNFVLTTSEDVYVFVPNGLFVDTAELSANDQIIFGVGAEVEENTPPVCVLPLGCVTFRELGLTSDVLLTILAPIGNLRIEAGGSIVVSVTPIPEPSTPALIGLGVLSLGAWRGSAQRDH